MMQLTGVDQALRQAADAKQVPGVVAIAATDTEVIYEGAFGKRDLKGATTAWEKVVQLAPDSPEAQAAKQGLQGIAAATGRGGAPAPPGG